MRREQVGPHYENHPVLETLRRSHRLDLDRLLKNFRAGIVILVQPRNGSKGSEVFEEIPEGLIILVEFPWIENADVLLANIDGYVIPSDQLVPFLQRAKVRTFIPTHYSLSTSARWQGAPTVDEFIKTLPADLAVVRQGSEIQVTPNMPKQVVELTPLALIK